MASQSNGVPEAWFKKRRSTPVNSYEDRNARISIFGQEEGLRGRIR